MVADEYARDDGALAEKLLRIHALVDDCIERRLAGEALPDEQVIARHPELMPELARELETLAVIERARRQVSGSSQLEPLERPLPGDGLAADLFPGCDIVDEIHRGGQGVVYRAVQRSTNRTVALKVVREGVFAGPREVSRFEREIEILGSLRHPGIVRVFDSGVTAGGSFYYLMDYIDGPTVDVHVRRLGDGGRRRSTRCWPCSCRSATRRRRRIFPA